MKTLSRLFTAAFMLFVATACNLSKINNPDDPNNNGSGKKEYSITAKIIQTRVLYTDGAVLKQEWEKGDRLIGCYKSFSYVGGEPVAQFLPISFNVEDIDSDGIAKLKLASGTLPEDGATIALVYDPYGDTIYGENYSVPVNTIDNSRGFDIYDQEDTVLPAYMSASAEYSENEGAEFVFKNDCAIIEVDGLSSINKPDGISSSDVSSICINSVITTGSYTFDSENGKYSLSGNTAGEVAVSCVRTLNWQTGVLNKPVFLAAIPNGEQTIGVTFLDDEKTICNVPSYGSTAFAPGKCYVIYPKEMVAKTVDNQYFPSVAAAFEHAEDLDNTLGAGVENTVTLVKKRIYGLKEINDVPDDEDEITIPVADNKPTKIEIDYPVTLDLNGCRLYLDYNEVADYYQGGFSVTSSSGAHFIVKDNVGEGMILSASYCPIIENAGTVEILSGYLEVWEEDDSNIFSPVIENHGTLKVLGGELFCKATSAIDSDSKLIIGNEGKSSTGEDEIVISCESGEDGSHAPAISCTGGSVDIFDGKVSGFDSPAILLTGDVKGNIYGGYILNGNFETIKIIDGAGCTISGGVISNETDYYPAVWCESASTDNRSTLTVTWPDGISNPLPDTVMEPLIYCAGLNGSAVPISAYDTRGDNTAEITINGGYLISHNKFSQNNITAFYLDDDRSEHLNLDLSKENGTFNFGGFYSNCSTVIMDPGHNIEANTYDLYPEGKVITGDENNQPYIAYYQGVGSGFYISEIKESTGTLYKIDPAEDEIVYPGAEGLDLKPVEIGGVVWAPVNCGYDADHPYGLLYQWGRKYGQDLNLSSDDLVEMEEQLLMYPDISNANAGKFFYGYPDLYYPNKFDGEIEKLWDASDYSIVEDPHNVPQHTPVKSTNDPCPEGWRVPSCYEFECMLGSRIEGDSFEIVYVDKYKAYGAYLFGGKIFLPFAGFRSGEDGEVYGYEDSAYYWSSSSWWNSTTPARLNLYYNFLEYSNHFNTDLGATSDGCPIRCVKE